MDKILISFELGKKRVSEKIVATGLLSKINFEMPPIYSGILSNHLKIICKIYESDFDDFLCHLKRAFE